MATESSSPAWARVAQPASALWVTPSVICLPRWVLPEQWRDGAGELDWQLHWSDTGEQHIEGTTVVGGRSGALTYTGPASADLIEVHRQLAGHLTFAPGPDLLQHLDELIRCSLALSARDRYATGVQTCLLLDDVYGTRARSVDLGPVVRSSGVALRVWAPTALSVIALVWPPAPEEPLPGRETRVPMSRADSGVWEADLTSAAIDSRYLYEVRVYAPQTGRFETNRVTDPYSIALTLNGTHSVIVDPRDPRWRPTPWLRNPSPPLDRFVDASAYELHIRDFSASDELVPDELRGTYLAFTRDGQGMRHLRSLAEAGMTAVQLLPCFDFGSVDEDRTTWHTPGDLSGMPPDGEEQQARVVEVAGRDAYNWGYDPVHWLAPEGSYASSNEAAEGGSRIAEVREMVGALHGAGLRVVMDQVFNHTHTGGQDRQSILDRIVPGYYHRLDQDGAIHRSAAGANVATERIMAGKLMVDAVESWARLYHVDGFRFDLMGFHSTQQMAAVRAALDALTLESDGVDGASIHLYGEGWSFGEVAGDALFDQARQGSLAGTSIATFSDRLRDAVRGGGYADGDPRRQGLGTGLGTEPNDATVNDDAWWRLAGDSDLVMLGLAGNLTAYRFRSASGREVSGADVRYGSVPAAYASQPDEVLTYVDAHDNETLFDAMALKLARQVAMPDRVRMSAVALAFATLAQTPVMWHAGADLLRSKSLDCNSYDSGDWFNRLDWTVCDNGFGRGLPPRPENGGRWEYHRPLLADPRLRPFPEDGVAAAAMARDLLRLRYSTRLFRLGSADLICAKVQFPVSGTPDAIGGVIVMHIDDRIGQDVDPDLDGVLVVFNATPARQEQRVPSLAGVGLRLARVHETGLDPVVRRTTWDESAGVLTIPARTVAVLVY